MAYGRRPVTNLARTTDGRPGERQHFIRKNRTAQLVMEEGLTRTTAVDKHPNGKEGKVLI